jgi:serine/threonine protein kinase/tetratricopeptide (TPR) repeat protein
LSDDPTLPGAPGPDRPTVPAADAASHEVIGPYRILQRIGAGGMGEVYVAEQSKPIRRRVAIKVIKRGMDSRQILARFQAERQALALMNHRCIAKVYDAGETPGGRPYIAMEYVQGVPLTEYCDNHKLDLGERLDLFVQVCEGVQHAHQKAVIHRDLKPGNVLVTEEDGQPVPKIIDFGVAKATSQRLTDMTMFTQAGNIVGTLEYMSPEQAELTGEDVDTRTDVYSLGAILYELLAGVLPFDSENLRKAGIDEMRRIIKEIDPPRPSTRLTTLDPGRGTTVVTARGSDVTHWSRALRGDVDWICLKALAKERNRRYESPHALAEDIRRYLKKEPIEARPPSTGYRMRKFVQRNRAGVFAAGVVTLALVGGIVATSWGLVRANRAEALARTEAERANLEAATSQRVTDFMTSLFEQANPHYARGQAVTVRQMLDEGAARIEKELADEPALQARLMATMGYCYRDLGEYAEATRFLAMARDKSLAAGLGRTELAMDIHGGLAYLQVFTGNYEEAETNYNRQIDLARELLGPRNLDFAGMLAGRAFIYLRGRVHLEKARRDLDEALAICESLAAKDDQVHAEALMHDGWLHALQGDDVAALASHSRALEMRRRHYGDEPGPPLAWSLQHITHIHIRSGDYDRAEATAREALAINRSLYGEEHPETAYNHHALGDIHLDRGEYPEALALIAKALAINVRAVGPDHPENCELYNHLAYLHARLGNLAEADAMAARSRAILERPEHRNDSMRGMLYESEGEIALARGQLDDARESLRRAREHRTLAHGENDMRVLKAQVRLAALTDLQGRRDEAFVLLEDAVARGYWKRDFLAGDEGFAGLRTDPRFPALLEAAGNNRSPG